jgi:hypothetical protein
MPKKKTRTSEQLINDALHTSPADWMSIDELISEATDNATREQLRRIQTSKYRDDQYLYERGY